MSSILDAMANAAKAGAKAGEDAAKASKTSSVSPSKVIIARNTSKNPNTIITNNQILFPDNTPLSEEQQYQKDITVFNARRNAGLDPYLGGSGYGTNYDYPSTYTMDEWKNIHAIPVNETEYTRNEIEINARDWLAEQGITHAGDLTKYQYIDIGGNRFYPRDRSYITPTGETIKISGGLGNVWDTLVHQTGKVFIQTSRYNQPKQNAMAVERYIHTGEVPSYVKEQIGFETGTKYAPFESKIEQLAFERETGLTSEEKANKVLSGYIMKKADVDWMKKFGEFSYTETKPLPAGSQAKNWLLKNLYVPEKIISQDKPKTVEHTSLSWSQYQSYEPGAILTKTNNQFSITPDPEAWFNKQMTGKSWLEKESTRWGGKFLAVFGNVEYIMREGNPLSQPISGETPLLDQLTYQKLYNIGHQKDFRGHIGELFSSSPIQNVAIPIAMGGAMGKIVPAISGTVSGQFGSKSAISLATKGGIAGIGFVMTAPTIIDIKTTWEKEGQEAGMAKLGQFGTSMVLMGAAYGSISTSKNVMGETTYEHAYNKRLPTSDIPGKILSKQSIIYEDFLSQPDDKGTINFIRRGYVKTNIPRKTGSGITYDSVFDITGTAQPIGENVYAARAEGFSIKGKNSVLSKKYSPGSLGRLYKSGSLNRVEAYSISENILNIENIGISAERGVAGIYGKNPDVFTSKGLTYYKVTGQITKNIVLDENANVKLSKNMNFGTRSNLSIGTYESNITTGTYRAYGKSYTILGEGEGTGSISSPKNTIFKGKIGSFILGKVDVTVTGESSPKLSGSSFNKIKNIFKTADTSVESKGTVKAGLSGQKTVLSNARLEGLGDINTTIMASQSQNAVVFTGGQGSQGLFISSMPTSSYKTTSLSSKLEMPSLSSEGGLFTIQREQQLSDKKYGLRVSGLLSTHQTNRITDVNNRQGYILINTTKGEIKQGEVGNVGLSMLSERVTQSKHPFSITTTSTIVDVISSKKQKYGLLQGQVSKSVTSNQMVTIPPYMGGGFSIFTPIPMPKNSGSSEMERNKKWRGMSFGGGKKHKTALKTVLADPFSVMESQQKFGKATHQLPTRKVWSQAESSGWRLGTVEMRKNKIKGLKTGKLFKYKKKRGRKK